MGLELSFKNLKRKEENRLCFSLFCVSGREHLKLRSERDRVTISHHEVLADL